MTTRRCACIALTAAFLHISASAPAAQPRSARVSPATAQPPAVPQTRPEGGQLIREELVDAARVAWTFIDNQYRPATGFVGTVPQYNWATVWDLASGLAALFTARELGFLAPADYDQRMGRALTTLKTVGLYDNAAFNKTYSVVDAVMADRDERVSQRGFGWSATDVGRLLIWLKVIATRHPQFANAATAVAQRIDYKRLVRDGYMWGEDLGPDLAPRIYPEGQIGYEQYAAQGFALWGVKADKALDFDVNAMPLEVFGHKLIADRRRQDRLTSEPFILMGLETGWSRRARALAETLLAVQEERARRTGRVTMVSEDAISQPPHFFYYYCVYSRGKHFSVDVQDPRAVVDEPRWVSTKAAFAWHALLPSAYTKEAVRAVMPARSVAGWSSGVYEGTQKSTGTLNINTAAVIMTAASYAVTGEPMLRMAGW